MQIFILKYQTMTIRVANSLGFFRLIQLPAFWNVFQIYQRIRKTNDGIFSLTLRGFQNEILQKYSVWQFLRNQHIVKIFHYLINGAFFHWSIIWPILTYNKVSIFRIRKLPPLWAKTIEFLTKIFFLQNGWLHNDFFSGLLETPQRELS